MGKIKAIIKNSIMDVMRCFLKAFFIFPIKKNRVIFEAARGRQYICNPRFISERLQKAPEAYEIVWAFTNPERFAELLESGIRVIKDRGPRFWYYRLTARVTVTNVKWKNYTPVRKGQYEIQTWHGGGGGYKKTLADDKEVAGDRILIRRQLKQFERYSLVLTSSATSLRTNARMAMQYKGVVLGGTPRNDMLINRDRPELDRKVRDFFGVPEGIKIALYAPTWRRNAKREHFDIDYKALKQALTRRFGGEWVVFRRMHAAAREMFKETSDDFISADSYPDMQDLLYMVDVLVSDYSSSIWDFSFTGKPCFLFCTDLDQYRDDRDFYNPITTWGFPLAQNNEELVQRILSFDETDYAENMEEQHRKNHSFETGHATEDVYSIIRSMCYGDGSLPEGLPYHYFEAPDSNLAE